MLISNVNAAISSLFSQSCQKQLMQQCCVSELRNLCLHYCRFKRKLEVLIIIIRPHQGYTHTLTGSRASASEQWTWRCTQGLWGSGGWAHTVPLGWTHPDTSSTLTSAFCQRIIWRKQRREIAKKERRKEMNHNHSDGIVIPLPSLMFHRLESQSSTPFSLPWSIKDTERGKLAGRRRWKNVKVAFHTTTDVLFAQLTDISQ